MALYVDIEKKLGSFHLRAKFEVDGETLALLGASGCGKSMTLKCIAGIERPDRGQIILDGETLFDGPFYTECTVDTCHPNDLGFSRMAAVIGRQVARMLDIPLRLDVSSHAPLFQ